MTHSLYFKIFYLQTILSVIVAFTSMYKFKRRGTSTRLIGFLFLCSFISNVLGYILVIFLNRSPNLVGSLYNFVLIIIVTALYDYNTEKKYNKWFINTCVVVISLGILNLFFFQKDPVASYNKLAVSFIIIAYCLFYFYRLIVELPTANVLKLPMFWFTASFLFFHAGTLFLFAFMDYLIHVLHNDMVTYWAFHNILSIVELLIILIGLYFDIRLQEHTHPSAVSKMN